MKSKIIVICLLFNCIFFHNVLADDNGEQSVADKQEVKEKEVKRRRKKVLMCNECGKPETVCECEGHKDGDNKSQEEY